MASTFIGSDYATVTEPGTGTPGTGDPVIVDVPVPAGVSDGDDLFVMVTSACLVAETPGWFPFGGLGPTADSYYIFHRTAHSEPASYEFRLWFDAVSPTFLMGSMAAWTLEFHHNPDAARAGGGTQLSAPVTYSFPSAFASSADISAAGLMAWHGAGVSGNYPNITWDSDFTVRATHTAEVDFSGDILVNVIAWADAPVASFNVPATSTTVDVGTGSSATDINTRHFRTEVGIPPAPSGYWGIDSVLSP